MSGSLLLHALSLNDRILEPNQLPVSGHVWGYDKQAMSRDEFVGNCISMLSLLDIHDAEISWQDDIMAFDVKRKGQPVTVIISLQDDSLTSEYFYFLGIWSCPSSGSLSEIEQLCDLIAWEDEGLQHPSMSYSVRFSDEPMQLPEISRVLGNEIFVQKIYNETFHLCGFTEAYPIPSGKFVISPVGYTENHRRYEIRHALYSLRNLMGLMSSVMSLYDQISEKEDAAELSQQMMALLDRIRGDLPHATEWDELVRSNGEIALRLASEANEIRSMKVKLQGIRRLFEVIRNELDLSEMKGMPSLMQRMLLPFDHVQDALEQSEEQFRLVEKQSQVLQPLMHSRMLASQQLLLEKILQAAQSDQSKQGGES